MRASEKKKMEEMKRLAEQEALDRLQNQRLSAIEEMLLENRRILDEIKKHSRSAQPSGQQAQRSRFFWRNSPSSEQRPSDE